MTQCLEVNSSSISVWFMVCSEGLAEDGVLSHNLWLRNHASEKTLSPSATLAAHLYFSVFCFLALPEFTVLKFPWPNSWCWYCTCTALLHYVLTEEVLVFCTDICKHLHMQVIRPLDHMAWYSISPRCHFQVVRLGFGHQTALGWSGCYFCSAQTSLPLDTRDERRVPAARCPHAGVLESAQMTSHNSCVEVNRIWNLFVKSN